MGLPLAIVILAAAAPAATADATALIEGACVKCHNPAKHKGGLDLSTREALLRGGDSGAAVVAGRARESLLYRVVAHLDEPAKPQKADKLPDTSLALLAAWIDAGARYQRPLVAAQADEIPWAFRPLTAPSAPATPTSIDGFIDQRLRARGLTASPPASRRTLIRRATFDLIGLPPTPEEIVAFERDRHPDAYARLVDRLLASPHHGERWGRHWLDVARYADSSGHEHDGDRPHAWRYRDFVIRAFNDDMPYDRFVAWQLAGDELAPDDPDAWAATGFLAAGPSAIPNPTDSKANKDKQRYDELDDVVSTIGADFLGLTVGCARCHDHKYDPFTSRDYYGMVATFITTGRGDRPLGRAQREWEDFRARARVWLRERKMADLHIDDADRDLLRVDLQPNNPTQSRVWKRWNGQLKFADDELRLALPAAAAFSGMI